MKFVEVPTYTATIYVGGVYDQAVTASRDYCDEVGLCVTVTPTKYVYTSGETDGVAVGLINYGRFPAEPEVIFGHARTLAYRLIFALGQDSASIVASDRTVWMSKREEDGAAITQALATGNAEVAAVAEREGSREANLLPPHDVAEG